MKVILINGSPRSAGCTFTALSEVAGALNKSNTETEIVHIGNKAVQGCIACSGCHKTDGCVVNSDVNEIAEKIRNADGVVFGSPVYYAGMNGSLKSFMDRLFYSNGRHFRGKPAAAIVSCRRGGSTAALDQLNKYFAICGMPVVSSQYWNMVHGNTPEEVKQDAEGLQIMRTLGSNMAWLIKCIKKADIELPELEKRERTNFIR